MTLSPDAIAEDDGSSLAPPSGVLGALGVSFHDVVDALDQLVIILSATGDAEYVNRAGREYLGLELAEARARWRASIHTDDIGPTVMARSMGLATAAPWSMQVRIQRHDGVYRWFRARVTPLRDLDGAITHWTAAFTDVDDTHALGDRLRVEEERLAALDGVMPGALFTFRQSADGALSFPFVSLRFSEITGVPVETIRADAGAAFAAIVPEDLPRVMTSIEESRQTLSPWRQVFRANHSQHGLVWVEGHSNPRRDADGGTTWHGALHDETARERAAVHQTTTRDEAAAQLAQISQSLRISEERFRLIFHESPAAKTLVRLPERVIVDANEAWLALNRYRREDVIGQSTSVLKPDPLEDHSAELSRLLEHGSLEPTEHMVRRGDGTLGISEISARSFALDGVRYAIAVHQDVTARRQAERDLRESSARFKQLAESIQEVFWLTEADKERVVYISPGYETIWGRSCKSLLDDPTGWLDAIHPDDRPNVRAALERQASGKYDEEYRVVRPDGTVRWVHDKAFPVRDGGGRLIGVAGVAQDVTEKRTLEVQLRQAQKLESIGSLAGGVAHDFNNWLTVIGGSTSLLLERTDLDPESLEILCDIKLASVRAAGLTRQLLAFSRKEIVEPQNVRLNEVVVDTERMLNRLLGEDVILTTNLAPDLWPVHVDKGQWSQVLINLAVNARDAMPRGGRLTLSTRNVPAAELDGTLLAKGPGAPHVLVEVTDSGTGMTPEVLARLFEPFFTTKAVGRGTGLGLAVVHGIVAQSGGRISVDSKLGVGTTFQLYAPALSVERASTAPTEERPVLVRGGTETILFVEDEEALRRFVKRALLRDGYNVVEACDGVHALELVAKHEGSIDLLVTDVVMPRLGGRELTERLHETRPDLRVLYTTGYTDDAVLRHGVKQAEVALVTKPFTYSILRARIRELLDR